MTITTYVNYLDRDAYYGWPEMVNDDKRRFKQYLRFKPDIKMKYVYYYDTVTTNPWLMSRYPGKTIDEIAKEESEKRDWDIKKMLTPKQIKKIIDLEPEGNVFVRLVERKNGQKAFLRLFNDMETHPSEAEIGVMFKRFVMDMPKVGYRTRGTFHHRRAETGLFVVCRGENIPPFIAESRIRYGRGFYFG